MEHSYFSELEKIANANFVAPEDLAAEPMVEDPMPAVDPAAVEATQANNSAVNPIPADAQLPASPEDAEALEQAVAQAQGQLAEAKEVLAQVEAEYAEMEKIAGAVSDFLPEMGALARLLDFSTNENIDDVLRKEASARLTDALKDEDGYSKVLTKTAKELFEFENNLEELHSREGREYVVEHLASFAEDEGLEKFAFEMGGVLTAVRDTAAEYVNAARNLHKIQDDIDAAKAHVDEISNVVTEKTLALKSAKEAGDEALTTQLNRERGSAELDHIKAVRDQMGFEDQKTKGYQVAGVGGAGLAAGALFGGKKIYDATQNTPEDELSIKTASVTINPEDTANYKGGNIEMTIAQDFLKIAGAAVLLDYANNESLEEGHRKEAAATFNQISRMGRKDMEENFIKIAQQLYSEEELHSIVAGNHNEELFSKVAFFTEAYDLSADELEKVAGADGVAAKGVGGALTDAKANIVEKVEGDKVKTETVANGELGVKKADDMRGYNVINNPGEYQVEKTASLIEEAQMRKQAAFNEFVTMDTFLKNNSK
jgi:hypothetical protein